MRFRIASILSQYTGGEKIVEIKANTIREALDLLDNLYPGIKFRFIDEHNKIRPHMNLFKNEEIVQTIDIEITDDDEIFIVQSLSGGLYQKY